MENQNCRVGMVSSATYEPHTVTLLETQYQRFMEQASGLKHTNANMADFFEAKARKIKKILENLME